MIEPLITKTKNGTWIVVKEDIYNTHLSELDTYAQALDVARPTMKALVELEVSPKLLKTAQDTYLTIRYLKNGYQEVREWGSEQEAYNFLKDIREDF